MIIANLFFWGVGGWVGGERTMNTFLLEICQPTLIKVAIANIFCAFILF